MQQGFCFLEMFGAVCFGVMVAQFHRHKTAPAQLIAFEIINRPYAVFLAFHDNILQFVTQHRFHRRFIFAGNIDMISHNTVKFIAAFLLFNDFLNSFIGPLVCFLKFLQRIKTG